MPQLVAFSYPTCFLTVHPYKLRIHRCFLSPRTPESPPFSVPRPSTNEFVPLPTPCPPTGFPPEFDICGPSQFHSDLSHLVSPRSSRSSPYCSFLPPVIFRRRVVTQVRRNPRRLPGFPFFFFFKWRVQPRGPFLLPSPRPLRQELSRLCMVPGLEGDPLCDVFLTSVP